MSKEITGNTFPLVGTFYLNNEIPIYTGGVRKENEKFSYKELGEGILLKTDTISNFKFLLAKGECHREEYSNFLIEMCLGKRELTQEVISFFKKVVLNGGIVVGKKIITNDNVIRIRITIPTQEEIERYTQSDNKREIALLKLANGKEVRDNYKKHEYEFNNVIAYKIKSCNSKVGMYYTDFVVVVAYKDKYKIKIKEN